MKASISQRGNTRLNILTIRGQADQDRGEDGASRALRDVPTGGGRHPASAVSNDPQPDTPVRRDLAEGSADMTGRTEGHLDEQARGDAVSLNILSAETPSGQLQRRVGPQLKVGGRGIEPTPLGFLRRGIIMMLDEPGGVAGRRPNGKCRVNC